MPGLNRKGPEGNGPRSGRKMGKCNPENKGKTEEEILKAKESAAINRPGAGRGQGKRDGTGRGAGKNNSSTN